jgi:Lrp/AsnC family transcriptional regulator, regulator for asnA, asnC and gidA
MGRTKVKPVTVRPAGAKAPGGVHRRPLVALDVADQRIIELLAADGRASNRFLAAEVGLTDATVTARLRRLVGQRVLGVTAVFDWEAAGYHWDLWLSVAIEAQTAQVDPHRVGTTGAWAFVGIQTDGSNTRAIAEKLATLPEISLVAVTTGRHHLFVHAASVSRARLSDLVVDELRKLPGIRSTETWEVVATIAHDYRWVRLTPGRMPARG